MVKAVYMVARKPGLSIEEFQDHWRQVHGPLVARSRVCVATSRIRLSSRRTRWGR